MACTNYQAVKASLICAFGFAHAVYRKDRPWNQIGDHVAALSQTHRGIYQGLSKYVNEFNKNDPFEPEQFVDFVFNHNLIQESDEVGIQVCPAPKQMILKVVKCMTDNPRENSGFTSLSYHLGIDRNLRTDSLASFCGRVLECEMGWKKMGQTERNYSAVVVNMVLGYPLLNVRME
ncbi:MAG: hypothetical protein WCJ70_00005 [bacterium]